MWYIVYGDVIENVLKEHLNLFETKMKISLIRSITLQSICNVFPFFNGIFYSFYSDQFFGKERYFTF